MSRQIKLGIVAITLMGMFLFSGCSSKPAEVKVYTGSGVSSVFRVAPNKDANGGTIYNFNVATVDALFDENGKILDLKLDCLEVASPNDTAHAGVPIFSGWPGQAAYLTAPAATLDTAPKEIAAWKTKLERGDLAYGMNISEQYAKYGKFFKGKTVAEVEAWFAKNTSDATGRPLKANSTVPADQAKFSKLSDAEKTALADLTSGASISLKDSHGDFIGALKKAWDTKTEVKFTLGK